MIINNNVSALNTYRQLGANQGANAKSMEKLSSGLRINRAGDDAAGLAISEKMRAQVRGLDQASRNSQDGISMIQTAEGALQETQNILQRMRELATQSANDTNVEVDRAEIQKEMNALTSEINRIGNTTEFNTQKILKGSVDETETKAALKLEGLGAEVFAGGVTASGDTTEATGAELTLTAAQSVTAADGETLKVNLGGKEVTLTVVHDADTDNHGITYGEDGVSATITVAADTAATVMGGQYRDALTEIISENEDLKGKYEVSGSNDEVTLTSVATGANQFIKGDASNAAISNSDFATGTDVEYTASSTNVTVNDVADEDALKALVGQGITVNGKTVEFYNANDGVYKGEADFAVNINEVLSGTASGSGAALADAISSQLSDKIEGLKITDNDAGQLTFTSTANGEKGDGITVKDGVDVAAVTSNATFKASFQVGANQGQSMGIEINDMRSLALGISGNDANASITGKDGKAIENAKFTATSTVTDGTDNENVEYALDVSTHESAAASITVINNAIESVSAQRSNLGAFQNRLEHTISNLGTSSENLSAAESRIRDVDMAKEVMEMTRTNILSQASQAMLAQANQKPQSVLQLLG